ncbi:MAG: hypothetical protein D6797_05365 [Bdellovibrio sp.]|nr:MAG: hypothetical protein D6797_05365 [Bdellovibrio sp.]
MREKAWKDVLLSQLKALGQQDDLESQPSCEFFVLGTRIRFFLVEESFRLSELQFLKKYYELFSVPEQPISSTVDIYHMQSPQALRDFSHEFWNVTHPFEEKIILDEGELIWERDFLALKKSSQRYLVTSASLGEESTDILDNLINAILRKELLHQKALLFHAAAVKVHGVSWVFFGPSGVGKSTLAKFSSALGFSVMASDQVFIQLQGECPVCYATPTCNPDIPRDKTIWQVGATPLYGLIGLKQKGQNSLKKRTALELYPDFLREMISFSEREAALCLGLAQKVLQGASFLAEMSYIKGENFWPWLLKYTGKVNGTKNQEKTL